MKSADPFYYHKNLQILLSVTSADVTVKKEKLHLMDWLILLF